MRGLKHYAPALAAFAILLALPAHAQSQQQQQRPLSDPDPRPMKALDPLDGPAPPAGRKVLAQFGACVADRSAAKARSVLMGDFRTKKYENALKLLSENNRDCFKRYGSMRSDGLLFAGALAERLLQDGDRPLNHRLALAAGHPAPEAYGVADRLAQCVVRSVPDETAALFATEVGSDAETRAFAALDFVIGRCAQGVKVEINPGGLRAMLATAAFRNVEAAK